MRFFRELGRRPWTASDIRVGDLHEGGEFLLPAKTVGLRILLAIVTVLFSLVIAAYFSRMTIPDWRPVSEPWLLWVNTALLVASSIALQRARNAARWGDIEGLRSGLQLGGALTAGFLIGQLLAWRQLGFLGTNPANAFFYLLTALHGLHLMGGLVAWTRAMLRLSRDNDVVRVRLGVELVAVYWHYLLAVWLVLFGLLLFS